MITASSIFSISDIVIHFTRKTKPDFHAIGRVMIKHIRDLNADLRRNVGESDICGHDCRDEDGT